MIFKVDSRLLGKRNSPTADRIGGRSFNGRTMPFGGIYPGSNPGRPARDTAGSPKPVASFRGSYRLQAAGSMTRNAAIANQHGGASDGNGNLGRRQAAGETARCCE